MSKHYIIFTNNILPQIQPDILHIVNTADAAANLGYDAVLIYINKKISAYNPINLINPFQIEKPDPEMAKFYSMGDKLKVATLPMPFPIDKLPLKYTDSNTIACKYYFPLYIRPVTKIVHSRDWNFIKAAIKSGIPAIYEHHHEEDKRFEPDIVNNPLFIMSVTVTEGIRKTMIDGGIPPEKVIKLHNGYNLAFGKRQAEKAKLWRQKLTKDSDEKLVVYSGSLFKFKGIDLLIEVAEKLPKIKFALAGGEPEQVNYYQQIIKDKQIENVTFLGHLPQQELPGLLQSADILAHPHLSGHASETTSPLKLFDYMASGTPIVASEIVSLQEFKQTPAISGWCETDNPYAFAECLEQTLIKYPRKPEGYVEILNFVQQFSCENRLQKIINFVPENLRPSIIC